MNGSRSAHDAYMAVALEQAARAREVNEVPVGAVVVMNGEIVGRGFNQPIRAMDPTAHAEIVAIREAAGRMGSTPPVPPLRLVSRVCVSDIACAHRHAQWRRSRRQVPSIP